MTCRSCAIAEAQPNAAQFSPGCDNCTARALAVTGAHLESEDIGYMTPQYRTALDKCFGEAWKQWHEVVKEWGAKVRRKKAQTKERTC